MCKIGPGLGALLTEQIGWGAQSVGASRGVADTGVNHAVSFSGPAAAGAGWTLGWGIGAAP